MEPESWIVLTVAAAFLLLGIATSPLAWVALLNRRTRAERQTERRFLDLADQLHALQGRLERCESLHQALTDGVDRDRDPTDRPRTYPNGPSAVRGWLGAGREASAPVGLPHEPKLIAVPNLASTTTDREATLSGLNQRYAAIWTLEDTGASPDVIARATGQPIGQIELILGLRRQIDGVRTTIPHARHE